MAMNLQLAAVSGSAAKALPGALKGGVKTRLGAIDFQSLLVSQLAMQTPNMPAAQLLPSVVNKLTDALLKASGKTGDATARSTLQRALTAALAPPGSSPPTTATLVQKVTDLMARLSGKTTENAGQQNEIPGNILDALPAKESPAPQKEPVRIDPILGDASAFARSIVAQAAAAAPVPAPITASASAPSEPARTAAPIVADKPAAQAADNLLARIVARAMTASDQRTAPAQPATTVTAATADGMAGTRTAAPVVPVAVAFEKLIAAIAAQGSSASTKDDNAQTQTGTQSGSQQNASTTPALGIATPHGLTFANVNAIVQKGATPYTSVDANAVIEQIVKGIAVQSNGQSSQIRLHLQPEQLGEVSIKLTVSGNNISANVVAQNASVREALVGAQPQLTRSLADAGLSLGSFSVDVSGGNAGSPDQRQASQHRSASFKIGGWDAATTLNDDQPVYDQPVQSNVQHALVINSLV